MLILFDLDGTLTDPFVGIAAGLRHAFDQLNLEVPSDEAVRALIGPPFEESLPALGVPHDQVALAIKHYRESYNEGGGLFQATVFDGIVDVLAALRDDGHQLALATSKPTRSAARVLQHFRLHRYFDFIGGATVDGTRTRKEDVVGHVLESLDHATGVMVGDRRYDVMGARAFGLQSIGVTWGYAEPGEFEEHAPDHLATDPADLLRVIRSLR